MVSFIVVSTLSFLTLCLGMYISDRFENRNCAGCAEALDEPRIAE